MRLSLAVGSWLCVFSALHLRVPGDVSLQLSSLVLVSKLDESKASEVVLSLLRMNPPSMESAVGFCVLEDLTATSKVALELALQLGVAVAMTIVYLCIPAAMVACLEGSVLRLRLFVTRTLRKLLQPVLNCVTWRCCRPRPGGARGMSDLLVGSDSDRTPLTAGSTPHRNYATGSGGSTTPSMARTSGGGGPEFGTSAARDTELVVSSSDAAACAVDVLGPETAAATQSVSRRTKIVTAAANFGLTAYSSLIITTVKMLHCVETPNPLSATSSQRLFIRGTWECNLVGWQAPFVILLILLGVAPLVLARVAAWSRRPCGQSLPGTGVLEQPDSFAGYHPVGPTPATQAGYELWCRVSHDARLGVRQALVESYVDERYWWESALMGQRLVSVRAHDVLLYSASLQHA
jgi:hypothetical protein